MQNDGVSLLGIDVTPNGSDMARLAVLLTPVGEKWPKLAPPEMKPLDDWR
jgi:hypothetical protein